MGYCSLVHLPRRILGVFLLGGRLVSHSAPEKIPFSARSRLGTPSAPDLGHFPAREAGGMPFCAGNDTLFCAELPRNTFCAGFGVFFCPAGGWYPILRRKRYLFLPGTPPEHLPRRSRLEEPSAQDWGCFPALEEGGYLEGMEFFVKFAR